MEPLEPELKEMLREWKSPPAPATLERRVFPAWRWLLTGSIRVPVPVGLAAFALILLLAWFGLQRAQAPPPSRSLSYADFQPVHQLQPRIIRSSDEKN